MLHYLVGQIQAVRVFDQCPTNLETGCISPQDNVVLKVGDEACGSVTSLDRDSSEEKVHCVDESFLKSRGTFSYEASPKAKHRM